VTRRIFFLSDFGHADAYTGIVKAVVSRIAVDAAVIDLAHDVPAHDLRAGSLALFSAVPYLPEGSIVLGVVDPGVGSARRAIVVESERLTFVGPDNGLFGAAWIDEPPRRAFAIENRALRLPGTSRTFDGRDVFGPAAACVAAGVQLEDLGPAVDVGSLVSSPAVPTSEASGEVWSFDRYGNAITTLRGAPATALVIGDREVEVATHFASVPEGAPVALVGSAGLFEIAVRNGSAREVLGLGVGARVTRR
jgi:S-adenosyl-L-methionine hydrolase (adenosine-forming)